MGGAMSAFVAEDQDSDLSYFQINRDARTRIRRPFPHEFSRHFLKLGRGRQALVIVAILRDPQTGEPTTRMRGLTFADGGHA
jgi:hypothetical protein